jgi:hypothetical protein
VPAITSGVLAEGAILVWMETDIGIWTPLPHDFKGHGFPAMQLFDLEIRAGSLRILYSIVNIEDPTVVFDPLAQSQPDRNFRWVIIPPAGASLVESLPVEHGVEATLAALRAHGLDLRVTY